MLIKPLLSYLLISVFCGSAYSLPSGSNSVSARRPRLEPEDVLERIKLLDNASSALRESWEKFNMKVEQLKDELTDLNVASSKVQYQVTEL